MYAVTRACSKGEISECGCDDKVRLKDIQGKWDWGGCSDDIYYGAEFSKKFVDSVEDPSTAEGIVNLHNNEVGRRVSVNFTLSCYYFDLSGSCLGYQIENGAHLQVSRSVRLVYDQSLLAKNEIISRCWPRAECTIRWCHSCQNCHQP